MVSVRTLVLATLVALPPTVASSQDAAQPAPAAPWSVSYSDGSNNHTKISREVTSDSATYRYSPMTPARSSSGTYSGGAPGEGKVSAAQTQRLWEAVQSMRDDPQKRARGRAMGTGRFLIETGDGKTEFIVASGPWLRDFDALLAEIRGAKKGK